MPAPHRPAHTHTHTCITPTCRHTWTCMLDLSKSVCPLDIADRVNKNGPLCNLCRHVDAAKAQAAHRGIVLQINWPPETQP